MPMTYEKCRHCEHVNYEYPAVQGGLKLVCKITGNFIRVNTCIIAYLKSCKGEI